MYQQPMTISSQHQGIWSKNIKILPFILDIIKCLLRIFQMIKMYIVYCNIAQQYHNCQSHVAQPYLKDIVGTDC